MRPTHEESDPLMSANLDIPRTHRTRRVVVSIVLILLVLVIGTGAAYLVLLDHAFTMNVKHEALLPTPNTGGTSPVTVPSGADTSVKGSSASGPLNILLIGSDRGTTNGRSDVIILAHISGDRKKVYLVHFPRDMYVAVPGHGNDKINAAYAYGGSQLLVQTLRNLVGVSPDHVAVVGFEGFAAMTDAIGGVDVYAAEASVDEVYNEARTEKWYNTVHVGMNHLDGQAALGFVRQRYQLKGGDFSRGIREQEFLQALLLKVLSKETLTNPARFAALVNAVARNLTVDNAFSVADIYAEALAMKELRRDDFVFLMAPITGTGTGPNGLSDDFVDYDKMARLSIALKTDSMSSFMSGH